MRFGKGELTLAILGDLLRHPATKTSDAQTRLEITDPSVVRVTLKRLENRGLVRQVQNGSPARYMLTRAGIEHLSRVRSFITA